jgi:hypothetical protein
VNYRKKADLIVALATAKAVASRCPQQERVVLEQALEVVRVKALGAATVVPGFPSAESRYDALR